MATSGPRPTHQIRSSEERARKNRNDKKTPDLIEQMAKALQAARARNRPDPIEALAAARPAGAEGGPLWVPPVGVGALSGLDLRAPKPQAGAAGLPSGVDPDAEFNAWLATIPGINKDDYTKPFDDAEAAARAAADAGDPAIRSAYDELRAKLRAGQGDFAQQTAAQRAALQARLGETQGRVQGVLDQGLEGLQAQGVDPSMLGEAAGQAGVLQADMATSDAANLGIQDRMAQVAQQGMDARVADSSSAETAALANMQNNLGQLLQTLGLERAGAETQYNQDVAKREQEILQAKSEHERNKAEVQAKAHEQAIKEAETARKEREQQLKEREASYLTGNEQFAKEYPSLAAKYPRASAVFEGIIGAGGTKADPMNKAKAERELAFQAPYWARGEFVEGLDENGEPIVKSLGFKPDTATIQRWVQAYYDTEKHPPRSPGRI